MQQNKYSVSCDCSANTLWIYCYTTWIQTVWTTVVHLDRLPIPQREGTFHPSCLLWDMTGHLRNLTKQWKIMKDYDRNMIMVASCCIQKISNSLLKRLCCQFGDGLSTWAAHWWVNVDRSMCSETVVKDYDLSNRLSENDTILILDISWYYEYVLILQLLCFAKIKLLILRSTRNLPSRQGVTPQRAWVTLELRPKMRVLRSMPGWKGPSRGMGCTARCIVTRVMSSSLGNDLVSHQLWEPFN